MGNNRFPEMTLFYETHITHSTQYLAPVSYEPASILEIEIESARN